MVPEIEPSLNGAPFDLDAWLAEYSIAVTRDMTFAGTRKLTLAECPFNPEHGGTPPVIYVNPNGSLAFSCLHSRCSDFGWADFRERFQPGYRDRHRVRGRTRHDRHGSRAQDTPNDQNAVRLDIVPLADVAPERIAWLWGRRVPGGKVTLIVGDPGTCKSFVTLGIAAGITNGVTLPDDDSACVAGDVLLWNGEDGLGDTIRPRAEKAGVNLQRLHVIRGGFDAEGKPRPFALADVARLGAEIERRANVKGIVIDPLSALLGGVDTHVDAEVRSKLQPLVELARTKHVAVIVVLHLTKREAERIVYRVGGSIGFVALARSVLLVGVDSEGRRAIAPLKSNLCAAPQPVEFRIDGEGQFRWGKPNDELTAEVLLRAGKAERGGTLRDAIEFFQQALATDERDASDVRAEAEASGFSESTQERARKKLHVKARRVGGIGKDGKWVLTLPKSAKDPTMASDGLSGISVDAGAKTAKTVNNPLGGDTAALRLGDTSLAADDSSAGPCTFFTGRPEERCQGCAMTWDDHHR
jgi:hypothetical protein